MLVLWHYVHWLLCPLQTCDYTNIFCFFDFLYTLGLTSIAFNESSKYIKTWYFNHKNQGSSVGEKGALSGFNSRVKVVLKSLSITKQNVTVPVELVGKLDN